VQEQEGRGHRVAQAEQPRLRPAVATKTASAAKLNVRTKLNQLTNWPMFARRWALIASYSLASNPLVSAIPGSPDRFPGGIAGPGGAAPSAA
jgi:hypothetical protein